MTAQLPETLSIDGRLLEMPSTPLEGYLHKHSLKLPADQRSYCTGLRRGYLGDWSIIDGRLYLDRLKNLSGKTITLTAIFPDAVEGPLFCDWYSGALHVWGGARLPQLNILRQSVYETEIVLQVEKGVVIEMQRYALRVNPEYQYAPAANTEQFLRVELPNGEANKTCE